MAENPISVRRLLRELAVLEHAVAAAGPSEPVRVVGEVAEVSAGEALRFLVLRDTYEAALRVAVRVPREGAKVAMGDMVVVEGRWRFELDGGGIDMWLSAEIRENRGRSARAKEQARALKALYARRRRPVELNGPPRRIAVVTRPGSAGHADFLAVLKRREVPAEVQLVEVDLRRAASVAQGMRQAAARAVDLVAVVRGGGARFELAPFDSVEVAAAALESPVPTVIGVGHASDAVRAAPFFTFRAETPSRAAEVVASLYWARARPRRLPWRQALVAAACFAAGWLARALLG